MDKYEHRRLRVIELKDSPYSGCNGMIARLAERIARSDSYVARMLYVEGKPGKKRIGDDMLEILEAAFALPRGWFDQPLGTPAEKPENLGAQLSFVAEPGHSTAVNLRSLKRAPISWPFPTVTYQRLMELKAALGPKAAAEAIRDIDSMLDVVITKWERLGKSPARGLI